MRIRWTEIEQRAVAKAFLEERVRDMLAPVTEILERAMKVALPQDRIRPVKSLSLLSWEAQQEIKTVLKKFEKDYFSPTEAMPFQPPTVEPTPAPTPTPANPPKEELPPREPLVIEFRVPKADKPDLHKILAEVPTPILYGYALERLMKGGLPSIPLPRSSPDVIRVEGMAPQPEPPPPTVIKADSVEDPAPSEDGRRRVLVYGLLPTAQRIVQEKAKNFLRIDATFFDANTRTVPLVVVDYVILISGIVTTFQMEQIKKRFATKERVVQCDSTDSVVQKLIDINSLT